MVSNKLTRRRFTQGAIGTTTILLAGCTGDDDEESELELIDRETDEVVADYHGHWHGELTTIPLGEHLSLGAVFMDEEGEEIQIGEDEEHQFDAEIADGSDEDVVITESHSDHVHLSGESVGEAGVVFQLSHGDEIEWESSEPIEVEVGDE